MRIDIAQLLNDPLGTQADLELSLGFSCLDDDLSVDSVQGRLRLVRTNEGVWATGDLSVGVDLQCARCLTSVSETIEVELDERFHLSHVHVSEGERSYPIDAEHYLDLKPVLRELVIVSTPIQTVCRRDCAGLCPECGEDLNKGQCECQPDDIDPRLAVLKALMDDGAES
jgi:uncharacterized protein